MPTHSTFFKIHRPFIQACQEFGCSDPEALWRERREEVAAEVIKHASAPSWSSPQVLRQAMLSPWSLKAPQREDGVQSMLPSHIKRICSEWLKSHL